MNDWTNTTPQYVDYSIPEFAGNPLISALNEPPKNDKEAIKRMRRKPIFSPDEREIPSYLRRHLPVRLNKFMFPNKQHIKILWGLYNQMFGGYANRPNPITPEGQKRLHGYRTAIKAPATVSFLTGLSGQGKTTLIHAIMDAISSPLIIHSRYNNIDFHESQIVFLKRNVPEFCTVMALCKNLGEQADLLLDENSHSRSFNDNSMNRANYPKKLEHIITHHHVGAIIVDDFQNIDLVKSDRQKELIALIINLREEWGVPIILIGTYKAANLLKGNASTARRLVDGGFHELVRPSSHKDEDWKALCNIFWKYQWAKYPLTDKEQVNEVFKTLYDYSQGITGIALSLYINAQINAIDSGHEVVEKRTIDEVYHDQLKPLHGVITALKSPSSNIMDIYDDLFFDSIGELEDDPVFGQFNRIKAEMQKMIATGFNSIESQEDMKSPPLGTEESIKVPDLDLSQSELIQLLQNNQSS